MSVSLLKQLGRFRADKKAVAAVEFAMVVPLMLAMLFGSVELELAVSAGNKLEVVADQMSRLLGAEINQNLQESDLDAIFQAATPMMYPYDITANKLIITLSSVTFVPNPSGNGYQAMVDWSATTGGSISDLRQCAFSPLTQTSNDTNPSLTTIHTGVSQSQSLVVADLVYKYPAPLNVNIPYYKSNPVITMRRTDVFGVRNFPYLNYTPGGTYTNQVCSPKNHP